MADSTEQGGRDSRQSVTAYMALRNASEAIDFYKRAFGAIEISRMVNPRDDKIMHAEIQIGGSRIYLADECPQFGFVSPLANGGNTTVSLHLHVQDADEAVNRAVEAGGTVLMPPTNMFWGDRFGKVADPFGHTWSITQTVEALTPEQLRDRMEETFSKATNCGEASATSAG